MQPKIRFFLAFIPFFIADFFRTSDAGPMAKKAVFARLERTGGAKASGLIRLGPRLESEFCYKAEICRF
jgi:hypothetical protein